MTNDKGPRTHDWPGHRDGAWPVMSVSREWSVISHQFHHSGGSSLDSAARFSSDERFDLSYRDSVEVAGYRVLQA